MSREQRKQQIDEFAELYAGAQLMVVVENQGLTAGETGELRKKIRSTGGHLKVFKNTLAIKALGDKCTDELESNLVGPNAYLFGGENFVDDLKGVMDFSKEHKDKFVVKCGTLDGAYMDHEQLKVLSTLPSREQLLAMLLGTLQGPVRGLVTALSGNIGNLANVLNNIKKAKEESPEA